MSMRLFPALSAGAIMTMLLAASLVHAEQSDGSTFTHGDPKLHLVARPEDKKYGSEFHRWVGVITLTGTLVVEFDRPQPDTPATAHQQSTATDTDGYAFFVPDDRSRRKLPSAVGKVHPSPVDSIDLDRPPRELLAQLIGNGDTQVVLFGSAPRYEWPAELTIRSFATSIDCDHRSYFAEVESIRSPMPTLTAKSENQLFGC